MSSDGDKTIAQLDKEAIEKFNQGLKQTLDREEKMIRHQIWRGSKLPPFSIEHMPHERERLHVPMTDEDRRLRKQWLDDQKLAPNEPRFIPELYPQNIFRRAFAKPWDITFNALKPILVSLKHNNNEISLPNYYYSGINPVEFRGHSKTFFVKTIGKN